LELDGSTVSFVERSSVTGALVNTPVAQASWNVDPMDGSGPSGITLDLTKAQIMWMDFEWLGVGTVRCGFVINGQFVPAHAFHHANIETTTYIKTASLPIRYEITNTSATDSNSTLKQICSTVISEEGYQKVAKEHFARRSTTKTNISTTFLPLVSIRLKSTSLDAIVLPSTLNFLGIAATGTSEYEVILVKNVNQLSFNK
jgi:hypothetical protein